MRDPAEPDTSDYRDADELRFNRCKRVYLETSAFNFLIENVGLPKFERTRAYQRRKGVIFVTSPMLLWEIMLNSDREHADMMLMAEVTRVFMDYPEIFVRLPILEMAVMAALQYQGGKTNRGAIYDGMHMAYAPYVAAIALRRSWS